MPSLARTRPWWRAGPAESVGLDAEVRWPAHAADVGVHGRGERRSVQRHDFLCDKQLRETRFDRGRTPTDSRPVCTPAGQTSKGHAHSDRRCVGPLIPLCVGPTGDRPTSDCTHYGCSMGSHRPSSRAIFNRSPQSGRGPVCRPGDCSSCAHVRSASRAFI